MALPPDIFREVASYLGPRQQALFSVANPAAASATNFRAEQICCTDINNNDLARWLQQTLQSGQEDGITLWPLYPVRQPTDKRWVFRALFKATIDITQGYAICHVHWRHIINLPKLYHGVSRGQQRLSAISRLQSIAAIGLKPPVETMLSNVDNVMQWVTSLGPLYLDSRDLGNMLRQRQSCMNIPGYPQRCMADLISDRLSQLPRPISSEEDYQAWLFALLALIEQLSVSRDTWFAELSQLIDRPLDNSLVVLGGQLLAAIAQQQLIQL